MLALLYFILFLAVSAALTWWRVENFRRHSRLQPQRARRSRQLPTRR